jgi:uncharacterized membrane protein YbaN (DUF454 family)
MENTEKNLKSSRPISLLLLIPALIFGIISMALAIVGLGLIPILPAMIGIILSTVSFFLFKKSYRTFTTIVISISIFAAVISVFRGAIFEKKVASDKSFDSTLVKTQEGIDVDLKDAFGDDSLKSGGKSDTIIAPVLIKK